MTEFESVKKLIGHIEPVGESHTDKVRHENLKKWCDVVDKMVVELYQVSKSADRHEHSMKIAGKNAKTFLRGIKDFIEETQ